jgi:hypothetical protein
VGCGLQEAHLKALLGTGNEVVVGWGCGLYWRAGVGVAACTGGLWGRGVASGNGVGGGVTCT